MGTITEQCSCIYSITNTINNKQYVGQTKDYNSRVNSHLCALRANRSHNRHLQNSFNKYGEQAFQFDIIEKCDIDELNDREQFWIEELGSYDNGYNLDKGGGGIRGYHFTEEQKKKISEALKGKVVTEEAKQHMRENHANFKGENHPQYGTKWCELHTPEMQEILRKKASERYSGSGNPNYGKKFSDEVRKHISEGKKEYFRTHSNPLKGVPRPELAGANSYKAHAVVCVNTGEEFETIDDAAKKYNISQSGISTCCSHKTYYAGKGSDGKPLVWASKSEYEPMTSEELDDYLANCQKSKFKKHQKRVMCISTGEIFESMKDACEKYNINPSALSAHCRGKSNRNGCGRNPDTNELLKWKYI